MLCLPSDPIAHIQASNLKKPRVVRLGHGVMQHNATIYATKAGHLQFDARRNKVWISNNQKRYVPALEDMIIGIVTDKHGDEYRLDIHGTDTATLSSLAFEGATRKNRPNLSRGAAVYCRVIRASKNMEAEVTCIEPGSNKSWVGGETLFGELKDGHVVRVSLALARTLVDQNGILASIGKQIAFESVVGANGMVWLNAGDLKKTIMIAIAIQKADHMEYAQWLDMVKKLFDHAG